MKKTEKVRLMKQTPGAWEAFKAEFPPPWGPDVLELDDVYVDDLGRLTINNGANAAVWSAKHKTWLDHDDERLKESRVKVKVKTLRAIIRGKMTLDEAKHRGLINEEVPAVRADKPEMLRNDSLDAQVDRFLMQAEDQDVIDQQTGQNEAATYDAYLRRFLMGEAEGDQPMTNGAAAPPGTTPADPTQGAAANPTPEQAADAAPQNAGELDTMSYSERVARLVEKSEQLLDLKGTIVRRALNYVTKNYGDMTSKEVKQVLEGNFGLMTDPGADPYDDDAAPRAAFAGPGLNQ